MNDLTKTPHLSELVAARTYDAVNQVYRTEYGYGIMLEIVPFIGFTENDGQNLLTLLNEIDLGLMTMQIIGWANTQVGASIRRWANSRTTQNFGFTAARSKYFENLMADNDPAHNWRPKNYRSFIIVHLDGRVSRARIDELAKLHGRFRSLFESLGTAVRGIEPPVLLNLYKEMLAPDLTQIHNTKSHWSEDDLINEQIESSGTSFNVKFGGITVQRERPVYIRSFSVTEMPKVWNYGASAVLIGDIFRPSLYSTESCLQCLSFKASDLSGDVLGMKAARSDQSARSKIRFLDPTIAARSADFAEVSADMAKGHKIITAHYQYVIYARKGCMADAETRTRNLLKGNGFNLIAEEGIHLPTLQKALPFGSTAITMKNMKRFGRTRSIKMVNAITLMPIYGEWKGNDFRVPPLMLLAGRRGEIAGWTPFAPGGNNNVCITGKSGQGKSVAMQEMMSALITQGGAAVVIDDGFSFQNSCAVLGGQHVDFAASDIEINPFAAIDAEAMEKDSDFAQSAIAMLSNFVGALCHPGTVSSDLERACLADAVYEAWNKKQNKATLADVNDHLKELKQDKENPEACQASANLSTLLKPMLSKGIYRDMFDKGCSLSMDSDLIVFEMSSLREKREIQAAAMVLLIFLSTQKMYNSPRDKAVAVIVDEAWALLKGTTADFIEGIARRARKYNGSLITGTQGVDDYFKSSAAEAAWANSDWRIFLGMEDSSINALKREQKIVCDDILERGLRSLNSIPDVWSEMIIHGSNGWDIARLILDDVSLTAFSSTADDVRAINDLIDSGMPRGDAITTHAKSKRGRHEH